jgi:hypothetical protein
VFAAASSANKPVALNCGRMRAAEQQLAVLQLQQKLQCQNPFDLMPFKKQLTCAAGHHSAGSSGTRRRGGGAAPLPPGPPVERRSRHGPRRARLVPAPGEASHCLSPHVSCSAVTSFSVFSGEVRVVAPCSAPLWTPHQPDCIKCTKR